MPSLTDYKGLEVVSPDPTGAGGLAIQNNFKKLMDWQYAVLDKDLATPPGSPTTGDRYIVGASATGDWAGHENELTQWDGSAWDFMMPLVGSPIYVTDEQALYYWDDSAWVAIASGTGSLPKYFDVYDATGGQTFTSGTITVNLDAVRINNDTGVFALASDVLTIGEDGTYIFIFRVSTDISSGTARSVSKCWLEADAGSGFAEVPGSRGFMYNKQNTAGENTATVQLIVTATTGDQYRVRANRVSGTDTIITLANGSGLSVVRLGMPGVVGGAVDPAGSNSQVQFNNAGVFGADSSFTFDTGSTALSIDNLKLDGNTLSATNTNGNLILQPNGTGAIQADSGGNTRGINAVDFQKVRSSPSQVANGSNSVICGGRYNTAGNDCFLGGGYNNSGVWLSSIAGGAGQQCNVFGFIGGGYNNSATAFGSVVCGGMYNDSRGSQDFIGGGSGNFIAWGTEVGTICGGLNNSITVLGDLSGIFCGMNNSVLGSYAAILGGQYAVASKYGQTAYSAGRFENSGDAQWSRLICRNTTINASAVRLFLDGASSRLTIASNTAWNFTIDVVASEQGMANVMKFTRTGCIVNDGGTTSISTVDTIGTDRTIGSPGAWSVSVTADDTNDALDIQVTGAASTNIRWVACIELVEVSYP